jgi:hypothetical protein
LEKVTLKFLNIVSPSRIEEPYFNEGVSAGFPLPADDFGELNIF